MSWISFACFAPSCLKIFNREGAKGAKKKMREVSLGVFLGDPGVLRISFGCLANEANEKEDCDQEPDPTDDRQKDCEVRLMQMDPFLGGSRTNRFTRFRRQPKSADPPEATR